MALALSLSHESYAAEQAHKLESSLEAAAVKEDQEAEERRARRAAKAQAKAERAQLARQIRAQHKQQPSALAPDEPSEAAPVVAPVAAPVAAPGAATEAAPVAATAPVAAPPSSRDERRRAKEAERVAAMEASRTARAQAAARDEERAAAERAADRQRDVKEAVAAIGAEGARVRARVAQETASKLKESNKLLTSPCPEDGVLVGVLIRTGSLTALREWLSSDPANVSRPLDSFGDTVLHLVVAPPPEGAPSAEVGAAMLNAVLATGADVNCAVYYGRTPLMIAAYGGKVWAIRRLVEAGACIDAVDKEGDTVLEQLLMVACASPQQQQLMKQSSVFKANLKDFDACVALIVQHDISASRALLRRLKAQARKDGPGAAGVFSRRLQDELLVAQGKAERPTEPSRASSTFGELSAGPGCPPSTETLEKFIESGRLPSVDETTSGGLSTQERANAAMRGVFDGTSINHQASTSTVEQRKAFIDEQCALLSRAQLRRFKESCTRALKEGSMGPPDAIEARAALRAGKERPHPPQCQQDWYAPLLLEVVMREVTGFPDRDESRLARFSALKQDGNAAFARQEWREAASQYTTALQVAPNSVDTAAAFNNRAAAHAKLEEWDAAFMNSSFAYRRLLAIAELQLADREHTIRGAAKAARRAVQAALRMCPGHDFAINLARAIAEALKPLLIELPSSESQLCRAAMQEAEDAFEKMCEREEGIARRRQEAVSLMEDSLARKRAAVTTAFDGTPISFDAKALPSASALTHVLQASCTVGQQLEMVLVDGPAREGVGSDYDADWGDAVSFLRPVDPFVDVGGVLSVSAQFNPQCHQTRKMLQRRESGERLKPWKTGEWDRERVEEGFRSYIASCKKEGKPLPPGLASLKDLAEDEPPLLCLSITVKGFLSAIGAMRYFVSTREAHSDLPPLPDDACAVPLNSPTQPCVAAFSGDSDSVDSIDADLRCVALLVTWKRWWVKLTANFAPSTCTAADSLKLMAAAAQASLQACSEFRAWPGRQCGHCAATLSDRQRQVCSRCECVVYCGSECQLAHWATHRVVCKRVPFEWDRSKAGMSWRERNMKKHHAMLDDAIEAQRSASLNMAAHGKMPEECALDCPVQ